MFAYNFLPELVVPLFSLERQKERRPNTNLEARKPLTITQTQLYNWEPSLSLVVMTERQQQLLYAVDMLLLQRE